MITFDSVSKTFRDGTAAVVDLDLTIPSGQITVIVGPSGCGKTTSLRMINRMIEPTKGQIVWDGTPVKSRRKTTLRRQMGYVIQSGGLFPHRTVIDNIGTVPGLLGWDKAKTRQRSMSLLGSVGLDPKLADRFPAQLSGGQQQRVGVARALAADPLVLLMDEPFSAVDPVVRSELHEFFLDLQRELSKTIVLITHDIDEAIKLGDQVAILRVGGKLAQAGTPQQVLDEPADSFVEGFVGRDRGYRSLSFLSASGLSLDSVQVARDAQAAHDDTTLIVDENAQPVGWANPGQPGSTRGLGGVFDPESDTLRVALDAALTSPVGLAVAVSGPSRRYAGVVDADKILAQVTVARDRRATGSADRVVVSGAEPAPESEPEESTVSESHEQSSEQSNEQSTEQPNEEPIGSAYGGETEDAEATRDDLQEIDRQARIDEGDEGPEGSDQNAEPGEAFAPGEGQAEEHLAHDADDSSADGPRSADDRR